MKVYFSASLENKYKHKNIYKRIINYLQKNNHRVFEKILSQHLPKKAQTSTHELKNWYKEWFSYISECDLAIIEGSYPSNIHIGFELGLILSKAKPTILLFQANKNPVFINKFYSSRLIKSEYTPDNLEEVLDWCLKEAEDISNRRFTFYISPEIDSFLEKISNKGISRSEYIRDLIQAKIKQKTNKK